VLKRTSTQTQQEDLRDDRKTNYRPAGSRTAGAEDRRVSFAQASAHARYERGVAGRFTVMDARQAVLLEHLSMLEVDEQRLSQDIAMSKALGGEYREEKPVELKVR
jgi:outer membrane protein TolC